MLRQGGAIMIARTFIHTIIREYREVKDNTYYVDVNALTLDDKKLFLSQFLDAEDYEWALNNSHRIESLFKENADYFQELIEMEIPFVYASDMNESGLRMNIDNINGEVRYV